MATGDAYRLTILATGQGSIYMNSLAFILKSGTGPDNVTWSTAATDFLTIYKPDQGNTFSYTDWRAEQLWGSGMSIDAPKCTRLNGRTFAGTITGQTGAVAGDALPPQVAHVTTLITGFAGRRRRGRVFACGQVENNQAEGLWTAAYNTRMTTAWNVFSAKYFKDTGTSSELKLGIWSERTATGCIPATPPAKGHVQVDAPSPETAFTEVTGFTVRPVAYSQRRRTRGVGR